MVSRGSMAANLHWPARILLPKIKRVGGIMVIRRDVEVRIGGIGASWSAGTRNSAISVAFALVTELAELKRILAIDEIR